MLPLTGITPVFPFTAHPSPSVKLQNAGTTTLNLACYRQVENLVYIKFHSTELVK